VLLSFIKSYLSTHRQNERVLISFIKVRSTYVKTCFNSCYQKQLYIKSFHHLQKTKESSWLGSHEKSNNKNIIKRKLWTLGPHYSIQLPQAGYRLRLQLHLQSGSAILLPYLLLENVYILYTPFSPLAILFCIIFQRRTCTHCTCLLARWQFSYFALQDSGWTYTYCICLYYIACMFRHCDQWLSLTFLTLCTRTSFYQNLGRYVIITAYMFEH